MRLNAKQPRSNESFVRELNDFGVLQNIEKLHFVRVLCLTDYLLGSGLTSWLGGVTHWSHAAWKSNRVTIDSVCSLCSWPNNNGTMLGWVSQLFLKHPSLRASDILANKTVYSMGILLIPDKCKKLIWNSIYLFEPHVNYRILIQVQFCLGNITDVIIGAFVSAHLIIKFICP